MKKLWIILAAIVIVIPLCLWWISPEQVLKRRTKHLMNVISLSSGTTPMLRQTKVFSLNGLLAPELEIASPSIPKAEGSFDNEVVESAFGWICRNAKESEFVIVEFLELNVEGERALARIAVEGMMQLPSYRPVDGTYEVTIHWLDSTDGWRFDKIIWKEQ